MCDFAITWTGFVFQNGKRQDVHSRLLETGSDCGW